MRRRLTLLGLVLTVILTLVVVRILKPGDSAPASQWVMGYVVGYQRAAQPTDEIDWASLTHIVVGPVMPQPDGGLDVSYGLPEVEGRTWARDVIEQAHAHGRQALLMVGGADSRAAFAGATATDRGDRLADAILEAVDSAGFDGVDVDWEPAAASDRSRLLALGQTLRARRDDLTLTAPVAPTNRNADPGAQTSDSRELAAVFDRLNVMTYGMDGAGWAGWLSWHSAALTGSTARTPMDVQSSVEAYLNAGVPPQKLGIGIGLFGTCLQGATGPRQPVGDSRPRGDDWTLSDAAIRRHYYAHDISRWDSDAQVPFLSSSKRFGPLGCTFLSYEDERSVQAKVEYLRRRGLGGVILWTLAEGHLADAPPGEQNPLLTATASALSSPR